MLQTQSTAKDISIATLLRRIKEMEATNAHLQTLLKEKRALSPSSSSGEKCSYTRIVILNGKLLLFQNIYVYVYIYIYTCVCFL